MMSAKQLKALTASGALIRPNGFDGSVLIQAWKYPPVSKEGYDTQWVDRLSLAISLRDDSDPRVEKEVEQLLTDMEWKG